VNPILDRQSAMVAQSGTLPRLADDFQKRMPWRSSSSLSR
jgi:hypothetical protein